MSGKEKYWAVNKAENGRVEILLYGYIGPYDVSASDFIREFKALEKEHQTIDLRINSGGGNVFEGIAIYNVLKSSSATISVYIDGLAASMASVIALAGSKVHISSNAMMMTHPPSVNTYGSAKEHQRATKLLEDIEATMLKIYADKTGTSEAECKEKFLGSVDQWFTAEEAVAAGLADAIYYAEAVREPSRGRDEEMAYQHYATQIAAFYTTKNKTMNKIQMTAALLAALPLPEDATQEAFEAALLRLTEKAKKTEALEADLEALKKDLNAANNEFETHKKSEVKAKIEQLLDAANKEGRISVVQKVKLAAKYEGDYEGIEELIATMPLQSLVTDSLNGSSGNEVAELMGKTGPELFATGGFERLKVLSASGYKSKWKEFTGKDPE